VLLQCKILGATRAAPLPKYDGRLRVHDDVWGSDPCRAVLALFTTVMTVSNMTFLKEILCRYRGALSGKYLWLDGHFGIRSDQFWQVTDIYSDHLCYLVVVPSFMTAVASNGASSWLLEPKPDRGFTVNFTDKHMHSSVDHCTHFSLLVFGESTYSSRSATAILSCTMLACLLKILWAGLHDIVMFLSALRSDGLLQFDEKALRSALRI
jgi:hypothetical protein